MSKKRKNDNQSIGIFKIELPYELDDKDTMVTWYERYKSDPAATITQNGRVYYRIITKWRLEKGNETLILCNIDARIKVRIEEQLEDENGNLFTLKGREMASFRGPIPDWYLEAPTVLLAGDYKTMGEYLTSARNDQG